MNARNIRTIWQHCSCQTSRFRLKTVKLPRSNLFKVARKRQISPKQLRLHLHPTICISNGAVESLKVNATMFVYLFPACSACSLWRPRAGTCHYHLPHYHLRGRSSIAVALRRSTPLWVTFTSVRSLQRLPRPNDRFLVKFHARVIDNQSVNCITVSKKVTQE